MIPYTSENPADKFMVVRLTAYNAHPDDVCFATNVRTAVTKLCSMVNLAVANSLELCFGRADDGMAASMMAVNRESTDLVNSLLAAAWDGGNANRPQAGLIVHARPGVDSIRSTPSQEVFVMGSIDEVNAFMADYFA